MVEVISIHIPKTAGTSFRNTLQEVYGEKSLVRVDIALPDEPTPYDESARWPARLPWRTKVIHGHFRFPDLQRLYKLKPGIPIITWLRDPVERVISNYFYLTKMLRHYLDEEKKEVNILSKLTKSLVEFAQADINRNRMSRFLTDLDLEDLFFVGLAEHFPADLERLSTRLGWRGNFKALYHNATGETKDPVPTEIRAEIARLNAADMDLFARALALRGNPREEQLDA